MVEVTIEITKKCFNECPWCSTDATPDGEHLGFDKIKEFLDSIENIEIINVSGGEPVLHPSFSKIWWYCKSKTDKVVLYTNAFEYIKYNTHVLKEINIEANVAMIPGQECYLSKKVRNRLLKPINQGRGKGFIDDQIVVSRNFYDPSACDTCDHILLQADGKIVSAPCKKEYSK